MTSRYGKVAIPGWWIVHISVLQYLGSLFGMSRCCNTWLIDCVLCGIAILCDVHFCHGCIAVLSLLSSSHVLVLKQKVVPVFVGECQQNALLEIKAWHNQIGQFACCS